MIKPLKIAFLPFLPVRLSRGPLIILSYLGIRLISSSSQLLSLNFTNLISKLQKAIQDLHHTQASWAGRIALSKMYLLPHILYAFQIIPLTFLQSQLHKLQTIITTFIWNGKHSWLKHSTLSTPVSSVGMDAPDIQAYYKEAIPDQAKVWWKSSQHTTWLQIEKVALASQPKLILSALLLQHHGVHFYLDTINATVKTWKAILQHTKGVPHCLLSSILRVALQIITPDISFSD